MRRSPMSPLVLLLALLTLAIGAGAAQAQVVITPLDELPAFATPGAQAAPLPKVDSPSTDLILPYFENDVSGGSFTSTLFALRNPTVSSATATVSYFDLDGNLRVSESYTIGGFAVVTRNLRDIPGLAVDPDGFSRGYATIESTETLSGDTFQVDPVGNFATGTRLVAKSELCLSWDFRFLLGGGFDGGTTLEIFVDTPLGIGSSDPSTAVAIVYDESGKLFGMVALKTAQHSVSVPVGNILGALPGGFGPVFGSLWIVFGPASHGGHIQGIYTAEDRYSVGIKGSCIS